MDTFKGDDEIQNVGRKLSITGAVVVSLAALGLWGCPQYNLYSQEMSGRATLAEAQSSRQVKVLEAVAAKESAKSFAEAEITRARGAAEANRILQNSLGGPDGYLRYLTIQTLDNTKAALIYVPTEGNLPITEAQRLKKPGLSDQ